MTFTVLELKIELFNLILYIDNTLLGFCCCLWTVWIAKNVLCVKEGHVATWCCTIRVIDDVAACCYHITVRSDDTFQVSPPTHPIQQLSDRSQRRASISPNVGLGNTQPPGNAHGWSYSRTSCREWHCKESSTGQRKDNQLKQCIHLLGCNVSHGFTHR